MSDPLGDLSTVTLRRIDSLQDANEFMTWLGERRPWLACDTETTGLDTTYDHVRLVQFGDAYTGWTIPWENWAGLIREVFRRWHGRYIFHNGPYDVAMLGNSFCGIDVPTHMIDDTMHAAHVLDSTRSVALKTLSNQYVDRNSSVAQAMLDEAMKKNGWTWATVPLDFPGYSVYAGMDTVLTARLGAQLIPEVKAIAPKAYDLELAFAWVVMRMKDRGVHIDRQFTVDAMNKFRDYAVRIEEYTTAQWGILPSKTQEVIKQCQADGIIFTEYTPGGAVSLKKEVLEEQIALTQHPLLVAVHKHRQTAYLTSHYLTNFPEMADEHDLLRADMFSLGARTGRMSIRTPALQTLPRRSEANPLANTVRNCINSRYENGYLGLCDWDQLELRVVTHLSQDEGLREAFISGEDFFNATAQKMFNDPTIGKGDIRRQHMKNAMYATSYGAGPEKFALTAGIPAEEGKVFIDEMHRTFPGIKRLQRQVGQAASTRLHTEGRAYVTSPLTGRRHYSDPGREYALVNYLVQGMSAELLKMKAVEAEAAGLDNLVLLVHDEMIIDAKDKAEAIESKRIMEEVMNDDQIFSVPLTAGTDFGKRWGEKGKIIIEEEPDA